MFGMVFLFGLQRHFEMVPVWAQVSLPFVWSQTKAWFTEHTHTHRWVHSRATEAYRGVFAVPVETGLPGLHFATSSAPSVALTLICPKSDSWWGKVEFSPSEDGQEGPLRFLQSHGKVVQLLLHQEASCLLGKIHSHHGAVRRGGGKGKSGKVTFRTSHHNAGPLLTCGLGGLCQRHRWRKHRPVWTARPWRSRSAPERP